GISLKEFNDIKQREGLTTLALRLCEVDMAKAMTNAEVIQMLDAAGVQYACIGNAGRRASNEDVAAFAREYPDRLIPWFRIWGDDGDAGVKQLEAGVKDLGCRGFEVSSYREERYINDPAFYPYYAKCVELDIPVRITTGLHLLSDRPHDFAHPKYLDQVARDFPDLTIIAGLAGWPWVLDLVAIATRHKNIYIDIACRRVKQLMAPGAGYEALLYYGDRILQDKIIFASGWGTQNIPLAQLIDECSNLPLKESVYEKWMYHNAARALKLA
ncbi:MAG: amidohydrolase family protein, partial [Pseudomonadales bacterium]